MAGTRELRITIVGDASSAQKALGGLENTTSKTTSTLKKAGAVAASALGSLGAASFLKGATEAAAEEGKEIALLANTLRKATGASKEQIESTEEWITKMQNATGIMDDQLRPALGKLVISGRSVSQAQKDLGVAADIAAARHVDLATVVQAMSKAALGNVAGLGRLGLATKNAAGETLSYDQILQNASKTMGGAAAQAADTAAGRAAILHAKFEDLKENVGSALLPVMESLTGALSKVTDWFNKLSPGMQKAVLIGGTLLVTLGPLVGLIGNISTAVKGLGIAMNFLAANPIVLIIAGIAALAAGLIYAYKHSETFRNIVDSIGRAVATAARFVADIAAKIYDFGKKVVGFLLDYTPTGQALQHLPEILKAVRGAFQWVIDKIETLVGWFKKLWNWIEKVTDPLGKVIGLAGKVAGGIGKGLSKLNPFASGTPSAPRGLALLGENGPELVDFRGGERVFTADRTRSLLSGASRGDVTVNHNYYGNADPVDMGRKTLWTLGRVG